MTSSDVSFNEESIVRLVVEEFEIHPSQLTEGATLEQLGLDSLGLLEMVVAIEAGTGKEISAGDLDISPQTTFTEAARILCQAVVSAPRIGVETVE